MVENAFQSFKNIYQSSFYLFYGLKNQKISNFSKKKTIKFRKKKINNLIFVILCMSSLRLNTYHTTKTHKIIEISSFTPTLTKTVKKIFSPIFSPKYIFFDTVYNIKLSVKSVLCILIRQYGVFWRLFTDEKII